MATDKNSVKYWENIFGEKLLFPRIVLEKCPLPKARIIHFPLCRPTDDRTGEKSQWKPVNFNNRLIGFRGTRRERYKFGTTLQESRNWNAPRSTYSRRSAVSLTEANQRVVCEPINDHVATATSKEWKVPDTSSVMLCNENVIHQRTEILSRPKKAVNYFGPCLKVSRNWSEPHCTYGKKKTSSGNITSETVVDITAPSNWDVQDTIALEEYLLPEETGQLTGNSIETMPPIMAEDRIYKAVDGYRGNKKRNKASNVMNSNDDFLLQARNMNTILTEIQENDKFQLKSFNSDDFIVQDEDDINLPSGSLLTEDFFLTLEKDKMIPGLKAKKIQHLKTSLEDEEEVPNRKNLKLCKENMRGKPFNECAFITDDHVGSSTQQSWHTPQHASGKEPTLDSVTGMLGHTGQQNFETDIPQIVDTYSVQFQN